MDNKQINFENKMLLGLSLNAYSNSWTPCMAVSGLLSPSHIPYKTSLRPEKDQKSVPITRPTCDRRTLVLQVFEVL